MNVLHFGLIQEAVVKRTRDKLIPVSIVVVTGMAWISISNHCAIGALIAKNESAVAPMHCHGNQPAPSKENSGEKMPCCKVLRATIAKDPTIVQNLVSLAQPIQYPAIVAILLFSSLPTPSISNEFDTGPPFVSSFAELILQGSILSHAPPFLA